jgi:hypothetical protein
MAKKFITCGLLILIVTLAGCHSEPPAYGAKVTFKQGQLLQFPDFSLTYLGQRHVDSPIFKPGFTYLDFKLQQESLEQTVSWSSGTGALGPALFEFNGQQFSLELGYAEELGWLEDDELVIGLQK